MSTPADRLYVAIWKLLLPLFGLFLLIAIASFLPGHRLWGVNHLAFYPLGIRIGALAIIALAFVPAVCRALYSSVSKAIDTAGRRRPVAITVIALVAVTSFVLFTYFGSVTVLLGDGQLISDRVGSMLVAEKSITETIREIATTEHIAPGTMMLYYLTGVVAGHETSEGSGSIRLLNCLLGMLLVVVVLVTAFGYSGIKETRNWLLFLTLSSGAMQLYFGHVENYGPLIFFGALYVISAVCYLHGRGHLWVVALFLMLGVYAHVEGILLVPSFGFLTAWSVVSKRYEVAPRTVMAALAVVVAVVIYILRTHTGLSKFFLPSLGSENGYGVLSPTHWLDVLNELLILQPVFMLVVVVAIFTTKLGKKIRGRYAVSRSPGREKAGGEGRLVAELRTELESCFVILLLLSCTMYLVLFDPEIGMSRDWDLFAVMSLAMIPAALLVLGNFHRLLPSRAVTSAIAVPALVISMVQLAAWVGINFSAERTTERLERTLEYDTAGAPYVYEGLSRHYHGAKRLDDAVRVSERAVAISNNPRDKFNLSLLYLESGQHDMAIERLGELLKGNPNHQRARQVLVLSLYSNRRLGEAADVAGEGTRLNPRDPFYRYYLGKCLVLTGRREEGHRALRESLELDPPPRMREDIDRLLAEGGSGGRLKQAERLKGQSWDR